MQRDSLFTKPLLEVEPPEKVQFTKKSLNFWGVFLFSLWQLWQIVKEKKITAQFFVFLRFRCGRKTKLLRLYFIEAEETASVFHCGGSEPLKLFKEIFETGKSGLCSVFSTAWLVVQWRRQANQGKLSSRPHFCCKSHFGNPCQGTNALSKFCLDALVNQIIAEIAREMRIPSWLRGFLLWKIHMPSFSPTLWWSWLLPWRGGGLLSPHEGNFYGFPSDIQ